MGAGRATDCVDEAGFRQFAFENVVRLFGGPNPKFFEGTVVAEAASKVIAAG